jgi:hypothetical protein
MKTVGPVLKSGVVNGMPYTLYSDGSINHSHAAFRPPLPAAVAGQGTGSRAIDGKIIVGEVRWRQCSRKHSGSVCG